MKLTPLAKGFIAVVVLAVIGFATWLSQELFGGKKPSSP